MARRRTVMIEMRHASNESRPSSYHQQRYNHLRHYTSLDSHNNWPFGMLGHIPRPILVIYDMHLADHVRISVSDFSPFTYKVTLQLGSFLHMKL